MFELVGSALPGCYRLKTRVGVDQRGSFVKIYHEPSFSSLGLETSFVEEYWTVSTAHVIRGMHFQLPPHDHAKLVCILTGSVMDVVVDLRKGSPSYGKSAVFDLRASDGGMVYIPRGMAHGFLVRESPATLLYMVTSVYAPNHDSGIAWDSIGVLWPDASPIVSDRDRAFPKLEVFDSPFTYASRDA
jgi:dTDP-4-dehydrorhamnose 3,5-epimerase